MRTCVVIPFYRHEQALPEVLARLRALNLELTCFLVDDGSGPGCAPLLDRLEASEQGWLRVLRLPENGGKGVATMAGFAAAADAGYDYAIQLDADGQHRIEDIPRFLEQSRRRPDAVIAGVAVYDASVPRNRLYGRYVTHFWVWVNTLSLAISDSMCGFRLYPLAPALAAWRTMRAGRRMDFDTEILVRLFWAGVPVVNLPTQVSYPSDGVSHFDLWRDNLRISWMHARLFVAMLPRLPWLLTRRLRGLPP